MADNSPLLRHRIEEARTGHQFECDEDDTILRAGLRRGLNLPYECNAGGCGSCKYQLLEGEIALAWLEAPGSNPRDRDRKRYLACQSHPKTACRIRFVGAAEGKAAAPPHRFRAILERTRDLTADLREFRLRSESPAEFAPGQYALMHLPGVSGPRAYSMSNVANDAGEWEFIIRHVPGGAATPALFGLQPGEQVAVDGPYGLAALRPEIDRDIVCIAGGSGLSPMLSIARGFVRTPGLAHRTLHFFYGGRTPPDICGEAELRELPGCDSRIRYTPVVSLAEDTGWAGERGFVHAVVPRRLEGELKAYEYYLAGPPPMIDAAVALLAREGGVPRGQIHYDRFF